MNIDEGRVPLAVGIDDEDVPQSVVKIDDNIVAKAPQVNVETARKGLWSWILAVVAFITGKTTFDKKTQRGVFVEDKDKDKREK